MKGEKGKDSPPDNQISKYSILELSSSDFGFFLELEEEEYRRWRMERKEEKKEVVMKEEMGDGGEGRVTRVLVVDDSVLDRKIVERLLVKSGTFEISTVDSGRKALETLGLGGKDEHNTDYEQKFDVVLTDYCMPEMDGYGLLKAMKDNPFLRSIPVVIMSSENDSQRISRCKASGAEDFIMKPLQTVHVQRLRSYARPPELLSQKAGVKRKFSLDLEVITEGSSDAKRRPCLTGVAVA